MFKNLEETHKNNFLKKITLTLSYGAVSSFLVKRKVKRRLKSIVRMPCEVMLFSDVGKEFNKNGEMSDSNWLGYGSCKVLCIEMLPHSILNRNQTGLVFNKFNRYWVQYNSLDRNVSLTPSKKESIFSTLLKSIFMFTMVAPSSATDLSENPLCNDQFKKTERAKTDNRNEEVEPSPFDGIKDKPKAKIYPPYNGEKLRFSRHARKRITELFPNSEREIFRFCELTFMKLHRFVGHSEFGLVAPKYDLKLIIRDKMLIGVSTVSYDPSL
ncbi:MAG: hypothetical protein ACI9YH_000143 [Colwellia sp.]|jgi:hypothetical protein